MGPVVMTLCDQVQYKFTYSANDQHSLLALRAVPGNFLELFWRRSDDENGRAARANPDRDLNNLGGAAGQILERSCRFIVITAEHP